MYMQVGICMLSYLLLIELWQLSEEPFFPTDQRWCGLGKERAHLWLTIQWKMALSCIDSLWCWGETIHREDGHLRMHNSHLRDSQVRSLTCGNLCEAIREGVEAVQKIKVLFGTISWQNYLFIVNSWDWKQPYPTAVQHWRNLKPAEFSTKLTVLWWNSSTGGSFALERLVTERNGQNSIPLVAH